MGTSVNMLTEYRKVSQYAGERRRRWFQSPDEDLIVWYDKDGSIYGFQLCYDRLKTEKALTWTRGEGYSNLKVDDGETTPLEFKQTPILVADGVFDADSVLAQFLAVSSVLPKDIIEFVGEKIRAYPQDHRQAAR